MRKLLLVSTVGITALIAGTQLLPDAFAALGNSATGGVCSMLPDQCLDWRRGALERTRATLTDHRVRIQEGVRTVETHATDLLKRIDAIKANSQLLAQRELDRRLRGAATLDYAGRPYTPSDVEAQARLWSAEEAQFRKVLETDIAVRRAQFADARERVSLAYSRVDSVIQMITADLSLAPVMRDLERIRQLSVAADSAAREVRELLDPVRSVLELPQTAREAGTAPKPERPSFDLDGWLRQNVPARS